MFPLFSFCVIISLWFSGLSRHIFEKMCPTSCLLPCPVLPLHSPPFIFPDTCCRQKNTLRHFCGVEPVLHSENDRHSMIVSMSLCESHWGLQCTSCTSCTSFYLAKIAFKVCISNSIKNYQNSNCGWEEKNSPTTHPKFFHVAT